MSAELRRTENRKSALGGTSGVFPGQQLRLAVGAGIIRSERYSIPESSYQPASLDLRLGDTAYRLRSSFLPGSEAVDDKLHDYSMGTLDLRDGAVLERDRPYLVPLCEELVLPPGVRARTNPRSSTGRLDVFTRVVTDKGHHFDEIPDGYVGRLYLEVVSRSFTIKVQTGLALNQLRLISGRAACSDDDIVRLHDKAPLLFDRHRPVAAEELRVAGGLFLSVDLSRMDFVGYRAKKNSSLLDLSRTAFYDPGDYWERLKPERKQRFVLEPEEFYLLVSRERVRIPPMYAAEMAAYDPTSGELRTHYAGFFDPGFGDVAAGGAGLGTPAVLEVRAHDVPFMIEHEQRVCKLTYERMQSEPERVYGVGMGSRYQRQYLALGRQCGGSGMRGGVGRELLVRLRPSNGRSVGRHNDHIVADASPVMSTAARCRRG